MPANWQYSDYEAQPTDQARLDRLRLHIAELEDTLSADTSGADMSVSHATVESKLTRLQRRREELEKKLARVSSASVSVVRFNR